MRSIAVHPHTVATGVICATELRRKLLVLLARGKLTRCATNLADADPQDVRKAELLRSIERWCSQPSGLPDDLVLVASHLLLDDVERRVSEAIERLPTLWGTVSSIRLDLLVYRWVEPGWPSRPSSARDLAVATAFEGRAQMLVTDDEVLVEDPRAPSLMTSPQSQSAIQAVSAAYFLQSQVGADMLSRIDGFCLADGCELLRRCAEQGLG